MQEPVLSDVQSVLQDAARGPDPPPLTTKPEEPPPPVQPERPTRKLSFYAQPKPADSQPQAPPAAAVAPMPAGEQAYNHSGHVHAVTMLPKGFSCLLLPLFWLHRPCE